MYGKMQFIYNHISEKYAFYIKHILSSKISILFLTASCFEKYAIYTSQNLVGTILSLYINNISAKNAPKIHSGHHLYEFVSMSFSTLTFITCKK